MLELFIVIIIFSSPFLILTITKRYFTYKTTIMAAQVKFNGLNNNKITKLEEQRAMLNKRLAVLEEIVTSRHFELSNKIAQL
ncbi:MULTISPECIES: hypothetical protein [Pseudoalteromonas]|uniref:hypothetical protein n=1 Tax=Pseudoalteromonas TaxID=53246 RepID=UPI000C338033|nr:MULTISPECIES: hypothetical protein [Pseudoalteromonas]MBG9990253.1 hypothetical protein [Pseudoalteromonas sp. NZS37]MBH0035961.1 hypothetical protein [Pseudoalteromonas sp. NZS71_1]PKG68388.1 hypothetical protein CXF75_01600 [Pseudoalteromonas arctica]PKG71923.1 hypothetical protein CXF64_03115 [Pseudoalteromonas sp. GutCa3]